MELISIHSYAPLAIAPISLILPLITMEAISLAKSVHELMLVLKLMELMLVHDP